MGLLKLTESKAVLGGSGLGMWRQREWPIFWMALAPPASGHAESKTAVHRRCFPRTLRPLHQAEVEPNPATALHGLGSKCYGTPLASSTPLYEVGATRVGKARPRKCGFLDASSVPDRALKDDQLVAKRQILGSHIRRVTEERPKQHHQDPKNAHMPAFHTPRNVGNRT